jgi:two-component system osmolarity sensor histidine kinase EnvZ
MRLHLKSILPRSLFGRAALILVVPIVTIQLVVSLNFIQRHFEGVTRQMTQGVLIEIRYLLEEIALAPDLAAAQARAADFGRALEMTVTLPAPKGEAESDIRYFWDVSGRAIITTLRDGLTGLRGVDLLAEDGRVVARLETPKGEMLVALDRRRVSASNPHQLLVLMIFASALMTLIAYIFLKNQLSPITRLALAAEAFGKGQTVPYRPRGATEVRAAGNAFLDMRARIERQIEQRTLLLSGVSHDLRTPLTRLKLGLSFLPEDEETLALLADVAQMERLVDEFLAFARGDAMETPVLTAPASLLRQSVENATRMGQAVTLGRIEGEDIWINLRPQAVQRALENLIGNAVRYGTKARVSMAVTDRQIRLIVEDNGPGIARDQREEAMVPFKRLDSARDPNRGGGVGLGLSIAADIARSHGGALKLIDSETMGGLRAELSLAR